MLQTPTGAKRVPIAAIARWEMPAKKFQVGDRVVTELGDVKRFRHHGKVGTIRSFDPKDQTFRVELDDGWAGDWQLKFLQFVEEVKHE